MSPRRKPSPRSDDFRTAAEKIADAKLVGTWWRCRVHGLRADCVSLAGIPYCDEETCVLVVIVVASGRHPHAVETTRENWNYSPHQHRRVDGGRGGR